MKGSRIVKVQESIKGPLLILEHDEKSILIVGSEERIDGKKIELTSINHLFRTFRSHRKVIKTRR